MEERKVTKKENFETLRGIVADSNVEMKDELVAFIDKQIASLDSKAEKAKAKAAEKKAEGDELRAEVLDVLTEDFMGIEDILAALDNEEVTKAKVTSRLSQLIANGDVEKAQAKTEDGKKIMVYKRLAD